MASIAEQSKGTRRMYPCFHLITSVQVPLPGFLRNVKQHAEPWIPFLEELMHVADPIQLDAADENEVVKTCLFKCVAYDMRIWSKPCVDDRNFQELGEPSVFSHIFRSDRDTVGHISGD